MEFQGRSHHAFGLLRFITAILLALFSTAPSAHDLNGDGVINILDVSLAASCFNLDPATTPQCLVADINGDGVINILDVSAVASCFGLDPATTPQCRPQDNQPPLVSIDTPADGVSVDVSSITLFGIATDDTAVTSVTVNGAPANVSGTGFSATVALTEGANAITVIAGDAAGNTASATVNVTRLSATPPPQISAVSPSSAVVGDLITLTGVNFAAPSGAAPQVSFSGPDGGVVRVPVVSFTATAIVVAVPAAAATGPLNVTVAGQNTTSSQSVTLVSAADFTLSAAPSSVSVFQGESASVALNAASGSGDFSQLITLTATGLPNGLGATFNPPQISAGQTSVLTLSAPQGQALGTAAFTIRGAVTANGINLNKTISAAVTVQAVTTSFIGRAVAADPQQTPLAGVTVTFLGVNDTGASTGCTGATVTDGAGNFDFTNLPTACTGRQLIRYDGSTVIAPVGHFAGVDLAFNIVANQVTTSPVLVHLPTLQDGETVMVFQNFNQDQTFRFNTIPNLSVTVYAGTVLTRKDGSQPNPFPLTAVQVPVDRLPDEMPSENGVAPFIVAFQPANAVASQPIAVTFPNPLNTPPATNVTLMTLDPTQGKMVAYGTGTVSADGLSIVPDADPANPGKQFGLVHFDWHGPAITRVPNQINACPNGPCGGDPVHFASGLQVEQVTDLAIPAPGGGISIQRTYRNLTTNAGPFGIGTNHNYSYFLDLSAPATSTPVINFTVPAGNQFPFSNNGDGTFSNRTEPTLRGVVMVVNPDGSVDVTFKDGTVFHFIPGGFAFGSLLASITDLNGNTTTLVRDTSFPIRITEIIDAVGRKLKLSYDTANRITQISDPIGRTVTYSYNSFSRLETVTDPEGGVSRYTYVRPTPSTENTELATLTDARGVVMAQNVYGLTYGRACNGAAGLSDDDLAALPQASRLACLNDAQTIRDQRVAKQIRPDGGAVNLRYTLSNPLQALSPVLRTNVTDARNQTTTYRFSPQGQPLNVTDPTGQSMVFDREAGGNLLLGQRGTATCLFCGDRRGGDSTDTRDEQGNILTRTDALGHVTTLAYDPRFNKPTRVTDALGNTTQLIYDSRGNLLTVIDANGHTSGFTYNSRGLPVTVTDALGRQTTLAYDLSGNLIKTTDALGQVSRFRYDGVGRLIERIDAKGQRTQLAYDNLDRLIRQTDAAGKTTTFTYDPVGNLLTVTDAKHQTATFTYDTLNRVIRRTDALGNAETFEYDLNGNLIQTTDRRGQLSQFAYNALNRLIQESYADGSQVNRSYDNRGHLIRIDDTAGGVIDLQYDALGRVTRESAENGSIDYTYDPLGRVITRQVAGEGPVTYAYDAVGNLLSVTDANGQQVTFSYDALNRRTDLQRSNGVDSTLTYDPLGRLQSLTHRNPAGVLDQQDYTYDANGNRQSLGNTLGSPYLTEAAIAQYDAANRLIQRGDTTYAYDANGNRISKTGPQGTTTYSWDSRNRLTGITAPNGSRTTFRYDAFGNLLSQQAPGPVGDQTTRYLTDDLSNVVRQTISTGDRLTILTGRGIDDHLAVTDASGTQAFILRDALNSTIATTDGSGSITQTFSYEPYGQSSTTTTTTFPIQYTGRLPVSDGLYYYRARFYDPIAGRFLSEDPIGLAGGINLFAYVGGNPVNLVDPLGLFVFNFSAGFVVPFSPGVAVGKNVSSTFRNGVGAFNGVGTEIALGVIASGGVSASIGDLDNNSCDDGAPFTINFGLGPRVGIQIRPRKTQNRNLSIFNPARFIDEISFGIGGGIALPISISGPIK